MVMIGIDAHKKTFTAVAVNELGRQLGERTLAATSDGCFELVRWARQWPDRRFAVEDCRHLTRRLESDLLTAGERLVRVHTQLMAGERRGGRERGKSDPIDALAVARVALREPDLPVARLDGPTRDIRLLTDHRETLVRERTRLHNRLRWHLHELMPEFEVRPRGLRADTQLDRVAAELAGMEGLVTELARDLVDRCRDLNRRIGNSNLGFGRWSVSMAHRCWLSQAVGSCQQRSSLGRLLGWIGSHRRQRSPGSMAPPLSRSGHRTPSGSDSTGVATDRSTSPPHDRSHPTPWDRTGKDYVAKRMATGNTKTEALRLLRRRISNAVYQALRRDLLAMQSDENVVEKAAA